MSSESIYKSPKSDLEIPVVKRPMFVLIARAVSVFYITIWCITPFFSVMSYGFATETPQILGRLTGSLLAVLIGVYPLVVFMKASGKELKGSKMSALKSNVIVPLLYVGICVLSLISKANSDKSIFVYLLAFVLVPYILNTVSVFLLPNKVIS